MADIKVKKKTYKVLREGDFSEHDRAARAAVRESHPHLHDLSL